MNLEKKSGQSYFSLDKYKPGVKSKCVTQSLNLSPKSQVLVCKSRKEYILLILKQSFPTWIYMYIQIHHIYCKMIPSHVKILRFNTSTRSGNSLHQQSMKPVENNIPKVVIIVIFPIRLIMPIERSVVLTTLIFKQQLGWAHKKLVELIMWEDIKNNYEWICITLLYYNIYYTGIIIY